MGDGGYTRLGPMPLLFDNYSFWVLASEAAVGKSQFTEGVKAVLR